MKAAGDSSEDRTASEDNTATTAARQLFSDHGRQHTFKAGFMARSMPALRALRRAREHCDVVFRTRDGAELWAHRFVLAARYAGCGAFFSSSEERTDLLFQWAPEPEDIVWPPLSKAVVSDLSSEMLELLIDLAYQVPIQEHVGLHNVRAVLDVAEALEISIVRDHCLQLLGKNLEPENCVVTYKLALSRGYKMLCSDAFRYIVRNFDKVWATNSQFQSLMPTELMRLLRDDELYAPNEVECAFGAILKWIAGNVEERRGHLPRLLPLIRFAFCSRADMEKVERDPLVRACEQAREVLFVVTRTLNQEPLSDLYWRSRPALSERRWLKPRVPKDVLFIFGGWTGVATNHLITYNCRSSRWLLQPYQDTPPRACHGVAILGGLIYFVGGFDGRHYCHTVVTLDVSRLKWASRSNMQKVRCYVSVAVLQGYIYAMGGFDGKDPHIFLRTV
ncbi:hypothetical protein HPB48_020185 [Haemaphysalis longicornis]|uniref:BTB domain-containing protein n=1 Tax=Haemaphysalis longicornis TaxID=44386 RepID=A0A9J6FHB7_HAELO|nr:hypothetical protein HPB48_020185 [Haemaphysalis longicornis]